MDRDSIVELQKIDCNCNDCIHMERDMSTYRKWEGWHRAMDYQSWEMLRTKAFVAATNIVDLKQREAELRLISKMKFQFDKSKLLQYGFCKHYLMKVSFIPNTCDVENQECFQHRRAV